MSRGPGKVQRDLIVIFQAEPGRWIRVEELVARAFPGIPVEHGHEVSVRRALKVLPIKLQSGVADRRKGNRAGWSRCYKYSNFG